MHVNSIDMILPIHFNSHVGAGSYIWSIAIRESGNNKYDAYT